MGLASRSGCRARRGTAGVLHCARGGWESRARAGRACPARARCRAAGARSPAAPHQPARCAAGGGGQGWNCGAARAAKREAAQRLPPGQGPGVLVGKAPAGKEACQPTPARRCQRCRRAAGALRGARGGRRAWQSRCACEVQGERSGGAHRMPGRLLHGGSGGMARLWGAADAARRGRARRAWRLPGARPGGLGGWCSTSRTSYGHGQSLERSRPGPPALLRLWRGSLGTGDKRCRHACMLRELRSRRRFWDQNSGFFAHNSSHCGPNRLLSVAVVRQGRAAAGSGAIRLKNVPARRENHATRPNSLVIYIGACLRRACMRVGELRESNP